MDFLTFSTLCMTLIWTSAQFFAMLMRLMDPPSNSNGGQRSTSPKRKRTKKSAKTKAE